MPDPKASNAVVALVAFYSGREGEYVAEAERKDQLLRQALAQADEARQRSATQAEELKRVAGVVEAADALYDLVPAGVPDLQAWLASLPDDARERLLALTRAIAELRRG